MSAQISQSRLTEAEQCRRAIARCEEKRDAAGDEASRYYYRCCLVGWRAWLAKVEAGEG